MTNKDTIKFNTVNGPEYFKIDEILCISEANNIYTYVVKPEGNDESKEINGTELISPLPDIFVNCQLNILVNSNNMKEVIGNVGNERLILVGNIEVPLHPNFSDGIKSIINNR